MSELYCRNNFCVAAGRFLSVGEDNENEIILTFTDNTRNVTRACFKKKSIFLSLKPLLVSQVPSMAKIFWFSLNTATA